MPSPEIAPSYPEVTVDPVEEPVIPRPGTTVSAGPSLIRMPVEVDLTQDSDEEVSQLLNLFKYLYLFKISVSL